MSGDIFCEPEKVYLYENEFIAIVFSLKETHLTATTPRSTNCDSGRMYLFR